MPLAIKPDSEPQPSISENYEDLTNHKRVRCDHYFAVLTRVGFTKIDVMHEPQPGTLPRELEETMRLFILHDVPLFEAVAVATHW